MTTESPWVLEDHDLPSFMQEGETNQVAVPSEEILMCELGRLRLLEPRVAFLRRADGIKLEAGIGGKWMYLRLYRPEVGRPPFIYVPGRSAAPSAVSFSYQGQPHIIGPKFLLPAEDAINLVRQLYQTGQVSTGFVSEYEERMKEVTGPDQGSATPAS